MMMGRIKVIDASTIKARNYRMVESLRMKNRQEQRRLKEKLDAPLGIRASHDYELHVLNIEKEKIRKELSKIKKSTSLSRGFVPPRGNMLGKESTTRIYSSDLNSYDKRKNEQAMMSRSLPSYLSDTLSSKRSRHGDDSMAMNTFNPGKRVPHILVDSLSQSNSETSDFMNEIEGKQLNSKVMLKTKLDAQLVEEKLKQFNGVYPLGSDPLVKKPIHYKRDDTTNQKGEIQPMSSEVLKQENHLPAVLQKDNLLSPKHAKQGPTTQNIPLLDSSLEIAKENITKRLAVNKNEPNDLSKSQNNGKIQNKQENVKKTASENGQSNLTKSQNVVKIPQESGVSERGLTPIDENAEGTPRIEISTPNNANQTEELTDELPIKKEKVSKKNKKKVKAEPQFDPRRYNPDGSLRTVHNLPPLEESIQEAIKARYLRWKVKPTFERMLTVGQIFQKDESGAYTQN